MNRAKKRLVLTLLAAIGFSVLICGLRTRAQDEHQVHERSDTITTATPAPIQVPTPIQPTNLHQWGAVTLFHGLPSDRVRAIEETADGTMWFGTDAGLARYDGRRIQTVSAEGLPNGRILALKVDQGGVLWVGTEQGAARFAGRTFQFLPETIGKTITAILAPSRTRAILATTDGHVFECLTKPDGTVQLLSMTDTPLQTGGQDKPTPVSITSLALANDRLLAGTEGHGIVAIENGKANELELKPRAYFVEALTVDSSGTVMIGARTRADTAGVSQLDTRYRSVALAAQTGTVDAFTTAPNGDLWVASDGHGTFRVKGAKIDHFSFDGTAGGLRSDHVYSIFVDSEDVVWFGTDRGVCRYDPHAPRTKSVSDDPESNFVRTLFQAKSGQVLAGTNRGLFSFDSDKDIWQRIEGLGRNSIYTISEDTSGRLLIGAESGLFVSERPASTNQMSFSNLSPGAGGVDATGNVRSVVRHNNAIYFASFGRGVERFDGNGVNEVWPASNADSKLRGVVSLYSDGPQLWIGTAEAGVFIVDGDKTKQEPALSPLKGSAIWRILRDRDNRIWLATQKGLYAFKDGGLSEIASGVDVRDLALASNKGATGASRNLIWAATSGRGLITALVDERMGPVTSTLDAEQGLPSQNAFAVLPIETNKVTTILIGTNRGIASYEPAIGAPKMSVTQVLGRRLYTVKELLRGLNLEYPQNSVVINVQASSSRTFPEQFQYAFSLFDQEGALLRNRISHDVQFALEGLKPGGYKVEVMAYSRDLTTSEPLKFSLTVAKAPFPWTSTALAILLGFALLALTWGYVQNRRIRKTSNELGKANSQLAAARMDLANEAELERRRIARDLHDQTLADLRNLMMLTDQLQPNGHESKTDKLSPKVFRTEIESISTEIRRICEDLSPSALENLGLGAALEWSLANIVTHAPEEGRFEYSVHCQEELDDRAHFPPGVRMQIYRIAQEIANNVYRHSEATFVSLAAEVNDDQTFTLRIENNGRDFFPKTARKGRGLSSIKSRAQMIDASVKWEGREGGGSVFTLRKQVLEPLVTVNTDGKMNGGNTSTS